MLVQTITFQPCRQDVAVDPTCPWFQPSNAADLRHLLDDLDRHRQESALVSDSDAEEMAESYDDEYDSYDDHGDYEERLDGNDNQEDDVGSSLASSSWQQSRTPTSPEPEPEPVSDPQPQCLPAPQIESGSEPQPESGMESEGGQQSGLDLPLPNVAADSQGIAAASEFLCNATQGAAPVTFAASLGEHGRPEQVPGISSTTDSSKMLSAGLQAALPGSAAIKSMLSAAAASAVSSSPSHDKMGSGSGAPKNPLSGPASLMCETQVRVCRSLISLSFLLRLCDCFAILMHNCSVPQWSPRLHKTCHTSAPPPPPPLLSQNST